MAPSLLTLESIAKFKFLKSLKPVSSNDISLDNWYNY